MPEFELQFPIEQVREYGAGYAYEDDAEVIAIGRAAREREALRSLRGVDWATASVLLHLAYPERYPILDKRALQALGVRPRATYSFRFWEAYREASVSLVAQAGVDGRTFDQGLWQWSKEQSVALC